MVSPVNAYSAVWTLGGSYFTGPLAKSGVNRDLFGLAVSNGLAIAAQPIISGNIQVHPAK